jgi:hypothetical protein
MLRVKKTGTPSIAAQEALKDAKASSAQADADNRRVDRKVAESEALVVELHVRSAWLEKNIDPLIDALQGGE